MFILTGLRATVWQDILASQNLRQRSPVLRMDTCKHSACTMHRTVVCGISEQYGRNNDIIYFIITIQCNRSTIVDTITRKHGTFWRQSWIQHDRLCWESTVAEIGNKVDCCRIRWLRSTLLPIRSTLSPVCTGPKWHGRLCRLSTKSTVLNSTLSPACTGL